MDPNATLAEIVGLLKIIRTNPGDTAELGQSREAEELERAYVELPEKVEDLIGWLRQGGFPPLWNAGQRSGVPVTVISADGVQPGILDGNEIRIVEQGS